MTCHRFSLFSYLFMGPSPLPSPLPTGREMVPAPSSPNAVRCSCKCHRALGMLKAAAWGIKHSWRTVLQNLPAVPGQSQCWVCSGRTGKGLVLQLPWVRLESPCCALMSARVFRDTCHGVCLLAHVRARSRAHAVWEPRRVGALCPELPFPCAHTGLTLRRGFWKVLVFANCCFWWISSFYCHGNCN